MKRLLFAAVLLAVTCRIAAEAPVKPLVAVAPLIARSVDSSSVAVIEDAIASELVATQKVRVLERAQMDRILKEQGFEQAACDKENCTVEMGRLLAVNQLLTGSVGRIGGTYSLSLRMVDVSTGEVMASVTRTRTGDVEAVLTELLPPAVRQLVAPIDTTTTAAKDPAPPPPTPAQPEKRSHWSALPWIAGGVVLVGGGIAAFYLFSESGSSTPAETKPVTEVEVTLP